jgi:hypothetical protein
MMKPEHNRMMNAETAQKKAAAKKAKKDGRYEDRQKK